MQQLAGRALTCTPTPVHCTQSLSWVFGTSGKVPGSVVNLSDGLCERICYLAAHTGIIYDKKTRKQTFLQARARAAAPLSACARMQACAHAHAHRACAPAPARMPAHA